MLGNLGDLQFTPTTAKHLGKVGKSPLLDWASGLLLSPQGSGAWFGGQSQDKEPQKWDNCEESGCLCRGGGQKP